MEDNRANQTQPEALVLQFEKRRYDGGSEIELIAHLELQQDLANLQSLSNLSNLPGDYIAAEGLNTLLPGYTTRVNRPGNLVEDSSPADRAPSAVETRKRRIIELIITGPMEVAVGVVGILTSLLAIGVFSQMNKPEMLTQSKSVLRDCLTTLRIGIKDTALAPFRLVKYFVRGDQ